MALRPLSSFKYFGGKARMSSLICDMLDYKNTTIYIEPFGGGARTLLNKPRHEAEIYNDAGKGLCAFMSVIGSDRAEMLIDRLYQTDYSENEFFHALHTLNLAQYDFIQQIWWTTKEYLKHLMKRYNYADIQHLIKVLKSKKYIGIIEAFNNLLSNGVLSLEEKSILENNFRYISEFIELVENREMEITKTEAEDYFHKVIYELEQKNDKNISKRKIENAVYQQIHNRAVEEINFEISENFTEVDEMDLAVATYVVYSQSRDGMGKHWSDRLITKEEYHASISRLYDVSERMKGVTVYCAGALTFLMENTYLNDPQVMLYLDPSYLDPENEKRNLGGVYQLSSDYEDHELLLRTICEAKSKILISNYDIPLYNRYLTKENGWSKMEYETTTSVGSSKGNKRVEVLWWNY